MFLQGIRPSLFYVYITINAIWHILIKTRMCHTPNFILNNAFNGMKGLFFALSAYNGFNLCLQRTTYNFKHKNLLVPFYVDFKSLHCGFHFSFIFRIRLNDLSSAQTTIYLCLPATTCNILDIFLKWNTIHMQFLRSIYTITKLKNMWHWYIQRIKDNAFSCTFSFFVVA